MRSLAATGSFFLQSQITRDLLTLGQRKVIVLLAAALDEPFHYFEALETFPNYIKFVDPRIFRIQNWKRVRRVTNELLFLPTS